VVVVRVGSDGSVVVGKRVVVSDGLLGPVVSVVVDSSLVGSSLVGSVGSVVVVGAVVVGAIVVVVAGCCTLLSPPAGVVATVSGRTFR
jgi:hypothetical protein